MSKIKILVIKRSKTITNAKGKKVNILAIPIGVDCEYADEWSSAVFYFATLKTTPLRLGRIFCPNSSFRKVYNTQSIPNFSKFDLKQNLQSKSSKNSF